MSFNRLNYDACTYKQNVKQSVGSADYYIGAPRVDCRACFPTDPAVNLGFGHPGLVSGGIGGAVCKDKTLTDVSSELFGITRKASNCPSEKFIPSNKEFCTLTDVKDCNGLPNESTRLSNPTCSLRCTGWNRWEWLCHNPQEKSLVPFDFNISNRLIVKDNHRPCIQRPINQLDALPPANKDDTVYQPPQPACITTALDEPSTHWKKCNALASYGI